MRVQVGTMFAVSAVLAATPILAQTKQDAANITDENARDAASEDGEPLRTTAPAPQLPDVPRLELDRPVQANRGFEDPCRASSGYTDCYRIDGKRGQKVVLTVRSAAFDSLLELGGPDGFYKQNDDGPGDGTDSMLAATLPTDGTYYVGVASYRGRRKGAYVLTMSESSAAFPSEETPSPSAPLAPVPDNQGPLAIGGRIWGTINETGAGPEHTFTGEAGQRLAIISRSDDLPVRFEVVAPNGHRWRSKGQINRIDERHASIVTLPVSGTYRVLTHAGTAGDTMGKTYSLSVEDAKNERLCPFSGNIKDRPPRPFASGGMLNLGADLCGNITPSDSIVAGRIVDTYQIRLTAQTEIDLLLRGYDWDGQWTARGEITGPKGFRRALPLTNSPPTLVVPATALYQIKVFAAPDSAEPYGDYELLVRPSGGPWTTEQSP